VCIIANALVEVEIVISEVTISRIETVNKTCFAEDYPFPAHNKSRNHKPRPENRSMTETEEVLTAPVMPSDFIPALKNPAVAHCCEVWESTRLKAENQGKIPVLARVAAHKAFQKSLPPLTGLENIRDFIACVAHGMLIGAILFRDGARLLYAAQVAHAAVQAQATKSKSRAE
jgi:hypothetical protein